MPNSVYYDTCIFLNARNPHNADTADCARILPPQNVIWTVCLSSEISTSEASIKEYVENCFVHWTMNGTSVKDVRLSEAKATARSAQGKKKALSQMGFSGLDFKHLICAVHAQAEVICSCDADFFHPNAKAGHLGNAVKDYIEEQFAPLRVCRPREI